MPIKFQPLLLRISIAPSNVEIEILKWDKITIFEIYSHLLTEKLYDKGAF